MDEVTRGISSVKGHFAALIFFVINPAGLIANQENVVERHYTNTGEPVHGMCRGPSTACPQ